MKLAIHHTFTFGTSSTCFMFQPWHTKLMVGWQTVIVCRGVSGGLIFAMCPTSLALAGPLFVFFVSGHSNTRIISQHGHLQLRNLKPSVVRESGVNIVSKRCQSAALFMVCISAVVILHLLSLSEWLIQTAIESYVVEPLCGPDTSKVTVVSSSLMSAWCVTAQTASPQSPFSCCSAAFSQITWLLTSWKIYMNQV